MSFYWADIPGGSIICGTMDVNVPEDRDEIEGFLLVVGYYSMRLKRPHWPVTKRMVQEEVWGLCGV